MTTDESTLPPPRTRHFGWPRFSLRTLLIVVSLLAIALAGFAYWREGKRREEAAADWLLDHGGSVAHLDVRPIDQRDQWVQLLAKVLPEYCLLTVYWVDFPPKTTDADLAILADLPNLKTLHLDHASLVTPAGLVHLRSLSQLEVLYLKETPAGDAGLAHAHVLHGLKELWIQDTGITHASIPWIASNRGLTHLDLGGARLTDESLALLSHLDQLEVLALGETPITSRGLEQIRKLPKLAHLYLFGTAIDDAGLKHLEGMATLQTLDIRRTKTTSAARERFQRAQPQCRLEE